MALLDTSMPIALGINALASAISEGSRTRIVLLAVPAELQSISAAANGAYGTVPRDVPPELLTHDLRQVAAGRRLSGRASRPGEARATADSSEKALAVLTRCERQIAKLVSAGLPNKEIGQQLNLTAGTIKVHLHNIYQKLEITLERLSPPWPSPINAYRVATTNKRNLRSEHRYVRFNAYGSYLGCVTENRQE
jgi:two-component system nitrate/nitrite response regulator NarL